MSNEWESVLGSEDYGIEESWLVKSGVGSGKKSAVLANINGKTVSWKMASLDIWIVLLDKFKNLYAVLP